MVVKRTILPAVSMGLALLIGAASPVLGIYRASKPDPLVQQSLVRVHDMATAPKTSAYGAVVAAGWRQDAKPGQLWVTYSTDGGRSYLRNASVLRKFRVAGDGQRGLSLDICGGRIWVASVANFPGDTAANRDVLLTSRTINGTTAAQAFVTQSSVNRLVSDVSLTCVGKKLLAVAWLEESFGKSRAKLLVRSLEPLGEPSKVRKVWGLGDALRKGGISVDASTDAIQVAWTNGVRAGPLRVPLHGHLRPGARHQAPGDPEARERRRHPPAGRSSRTERRGELHGCGEDQGPGVR